MRLALAALLVAAIPACSSNTNTLRQDGPADSGAPLDATVSGPPGTNDASDDALPPTDATSSTRDSDIPDAIAGDSDIPDAVAGDSDIPDAVADVADTGTPLDAAGDATPDASSGSVDCATSKVTLAPSSAWSMPQSEDDAYVCYTVPVPVGAGAGHVMSISPNIDNKTIAYKAFLFQAESLGGVTTTPTLCNPGGSLSWHLVYVWASGTQPLRTPPNVGFPYDSTTNWIVQIHYSNLGGLAGQTDHTGFSLCTTDQPVQYDADIMALGSMQFTIPPNSTLGWTCPLTLASVYDGLHLFAAMPHLQGLGLEIESEQVQDGGSIVSLGRNAPWNVDSQPWFPIDATLHTGDTVTTRCAWQNDTAAPVSFGDYTEDEQCYSFAAYYPKSTVLQSWAEPALGTAGACVSSDAGLPTPDAGQVPDGDTLEGPDAGL